MVNALDIRYDHGSLVHVVAAYSTGDDADSSLVAIGGEHSVDVIQVTMQASRTLATFHVGSRITAIAWSNRTVSPASAEEWNIELSVAGANFGLHLCTKSASSTEHVFAFGGGLSGHHGQVQSMTYCGGRGDDSSRYLATVADDKMLMVWDLSPSGENARSTSPSMDEDAEERSVKSTPSISDRTQPTAFVIPFPHPLTTVNSHPSTSKEFLVSDCRGSIFLTDWRSDPGDAFELGGDNADEGGFYRQHSVVELVEPHCLANSVQGQPVAFSGSVSWRKDSPEIIGATYGSKFAIWDISKLHGGKPTVTGTSFPEGGHRFKWCHSFPEYFAVSTQSPLKGAIIHLHNVNYVHAQPNKIPLAPRPHLIRDFEFVASITAPRIAAAVGNQVIVFSVGFE